MNETATAWPEPAQDDPPATNARTQGEIPSVAVPSSVANFLTGRIGRKQRAKNARWLDDKGDDLSKSDIDQFFTDLNELTKQYELSTHEIELLLAAFHWAREGNKTAHFKSPYEWLTLAANGRPSNREKYLSAISTLEKGRKHIIGGNLLTSPLVTVDRKKGFTVRISDQLARWDKSILKIPLGIVGFLRENKIGERIQAHQVRTYIALLRRYADARKGPKETFKLTETELLNRAGLSEWAKSRNGHKARQALRQTLEALTKARIIDRLEVLAQGYNITLSERHLKQIGAFVNKTKTGRPLKAIKGGRK
jgi:hypothetical protein